MRPRPRGPTLRPAPPKESFLSHDFPNVEPGDVCQDLALQDIDLSQLDLSLVHFRRVVLGSARFAGSRSRSFVLRDVVMNACDCAGVEWARPTLSRAELLDCRFTGAQIDTCTWEQVRAESSSFRDASFTRGRVSAARFIRCDFRGAYFQEMDLRGVILGDCNLEGASFEKCKLAGADLRGSKISGMSLQLAALQDLIVDPFQAADLLSGWGAWIASEGEDLSEPEKKP